MNVTPVILSGQQNELPITIKCLTFFLALLDSPSTLNLRFLHALGDFPNGFSVGVVIRPVPLGFYACSNICWYFRLALSAILAIISAASLFVFFLRSLIWNVPSFSSLSSNTAFCLAFCSNGASRMLVTRDESIGL